MRNKGITLIALVITIIILIILAGVSINLVFGQNGLIERAKNSGELYSQGQAKEKLNIALAGLQVDKNIDREQKEYNEDEYITNKLIENGMEVNGDLVTVEGWMFLIDRTTLQIIEELGKKTDKTDSLPTIVKVEEKVDRTEIKLSINLQNQENAKITYILKDNNGTVLKKVENSTDLSCTFTGLEEGKTYTITVQTVNEHGTSTRNITVTTKAPVLVSKITLSKTSTKILMEQTETLTYKIEPSNAENKNVSWESSDETIATVDNNGLITSVGSGKCTITCKSEDGGATAQCEVIVSNAKYIKTVIDLQTMSMDGEYILANDIDLEGIAWTSLGDSSNQFIGTLDGQGYSIKNLTMPLFDYINNATITNIKFENVAINSPSSNNMATVAKKIGASGNVKLNNIGVTGQISGKDCVGGLIGYNEGNNNNISNCYVKANIVNASVNAGGILGYSRYSGCAINNCYFSGSIVARDMAGPIIHSDNWELTQIPPTTTVTNCYYDSQINSSLKVPSNGGIGLQTSDFTNINSFDASWDFENTWMIKDGYPELRVFNKTKTN